MRAELLTAPPSAPHPAVENLSTVYELGLPALSPELIRGILRQGHKLLIAGPSKAFKSFALIELAVAIAEGLPWIGFQCRPGRVLYVNLEIDRASFLGRMDRVYEEVAPSRKHANNIDLLHLRGQNKPLAELAGEISQLGENGDYSAIILDPVYKLMSGGDENAAGEIGAFCNQLDRIARDTGAAVIYAHHFSKGAQGGKRSIDRASGSGVFGRDPDAVITFSELEKTDEARRWLERKYEEIDSSWRSPDAYDANFDRDRQVLIERVTAWRAEFTLREFATPAPVDLWARYPIHVKDRAGVLSEAAIIGGTTTPQDVQRARFDADTARLEAHFFTRGGEPVMVNTLVEELGVKRDTVVRRVNNSERLETFKLVDKQNAPLYVREKARLPIDL